MSDLASPLLSVMRDEVEVFWCCPPPPLHQGMSDLASPLLFVMRDEAEAFWCFVALMERVEGNFDQDQQGMHTQLRALKALMQVGGPGPAGHARAAEGTQGAHAGVGWGMLRAVMPGGGSFFCVYGRAHIWGGNEGGGEDCLHS